MYRSISVAKHTMGGNKFKNDPRELPSKAGKAEAIARNNAIQERNQKLREAANKLPYGWICCLCNTYNQGRRTPVSICICTHTGGQCPQSQCWMVRPVQQHEGAGDLVSYIPHRVIGAVNAVGWVHASCSHYRAGLNPLKVCNRETCSGLGYPTNQYLVVHQITE
jgi:hypothetical protein